VSGRAGGLEAVSQEDRTGLWRLQVGVERFGHGTGTGQKNHALAQRLDLDLDADREFATAAGYVLSVLKHLPKEGEHFIEQGWRFEIVDMDGRKIDKLLVERPQVEEAGAD